MYSLSLAPPCGAGLLARRPPPRRAAKAPLAVASAVLDVVSETARTESFDLHNGRRVRRGEASRIKRAAA